MGFRYRKSFGKGPFRVTVSKSGIGYSAGVKGFRVTKKAGGGIRTTASIPGTGISYVTDSSSRKASAPEQPVQAAPATTEGGDRYCWNCYRKLGPAETVCPKCGMLDSGRTDPKEKPFWARWWFVLIVIVVIGRACGAIAANEPGETVPETTASIISTTETTVPETEATVPTTQNEWWLKEDPIFSSTAKTTYILNTDTKVFHKTTCGYADNITDSNRSESTKDRQDLIFGGYEPCGHCNP